MRHENLSMNRLFPSYKIGYVALGIVLLGSLGWFLLDQPFSDSGLTLAQRVYIGERSWRVFEVASTAETRTQGLAGRMSIEQQTGMLFVFSSEDRYGFWMKGMQFPLDIIFIRNGVVDSVARNRLPGDLTPVYPHSPVTHVFEVNAGEAAEVEAGQKVIWK